MGKQGDKNCSNYLRLVCRCCLLVVLCCSCHRTVCETSHLVLDSWAADVKTNVNIFMDKCAHTENAYVVFDFDNTCSIFDMEEQTLVYQLETMSYALSPDEMEVALSSDVDRTKPELDGWLQDIVTAYTHLYDEYGPFCPGGLTEEKQTEIHQNKWWQEFSTKMMAFYDTLTDVEGTKVSYVWILYGFTGMTENELYELSQRAYKKYSQVKTEKATWKSPEDIPSKVGPVSCGITYGVQVTDNIRELWQCLYENGIDVWVCSASGVQPIMAAIDFFGLHPYCKGLLGMTLKMENGKYASAYDYVDGYPYLAEQDGTWSKSTLPTQAQTSGEGKVTSIANALMPLYGGKGPLAGFMDSTGDFWFCTMFSDMKMALCFNRANRKVTDGGGLIAEMAIYQRDCLGMDITKADSLHETFYLLQGRDENGLRSLRPSNQTLRVGDTEERLFANEDNQAVLDFMMANHLTTREAIEKFCIHTTDSLIGVTYGWTDAYEGYHSK